MSNLLNPNRSFTVPNPPQQPPKENPINVLDLTLLLKAMGFRLNYLDYEEAEKTPVAHSPCPTDVTVEIRCGNRQLVSRLSASEDHCTCPAKKGDQDNDSSFWEILGTAPSSSPGKKTIEETSSNLLPNLSKRGMTNTKQLLSLIFEGFHKDHLPSTTSHNSPEQRALAPPNPIHTSTQVKSPRRVIPVMNADLLNEDVGAGQQGISPSPLTAPPNTPKVGTAPGSGFVTHVRPTGSSFMNSSRHRDHMAYMEVVAAKEQLEKALLSMKMNIAGDFGQIHGPPLNLSTAKLFEENESPQAKATFKRRSSMGSFPNLKAKGDAVNKLKSPLVRNKSSIDTGAAMKAKSAAATGPVTSRYLQPKKTASVTAKPSVSPMGNRKPTHGPSKGAMPKKSPATTGWK